MIHHTKFALGIVLTLILITTYGHSLQPSASALPPADDQVLQTGNTADPCAIALMPHEGTSRTDEAIMRLQQAAHQTEKRLAYMERLGWAFVAKARSSFAPGFYTLAEQCAQCMMSMQPESSEALLLRGHILNHLHRFREAEALARQLVAQRGKPYDYGLLGDALMEQGKLDGAVAAYDVMLQQKPGPQGYVRAAHVRWLTGDLPGAMQLMQMAAAGFRDPEAAAWSHVRLALYELQAGQVQQAKGRIAATLAARPDYEPALVVHGRLLLAEDNPQNAIEPLKRAVALNPSPESQWLLIEALHAAGHTDEARGVEQELMQHGAANDRRTFALYLATTGQDPNLAVRLAREELEVREDALTLDTLAWALRAAGKLQEARAVNARAMQAGTQDARLFYHAGVIAAAAGEHQAASHWFAKAKADQQILLPSERAQLTKAAAAIL